MYSSCYCCPSCFDGKVYKEEYGVYTAFQRKVGCSMFDNNFGKCGPILKILPPDDS